MLIPGAREDLCLAYANTLSWRGSRAPSDSLGGWGDLVAWLRDTAGLTPEIIEAADREREKRAALFADAIAIREAIYRMFSAVADGNAIAADDLALLNRSLAGTPPRDRLVATDGCYLWASNQIAPSASALLAPVLWSAADLLTRVDHGQLRRCANDECLWLFLDRSKAGTRRWCDMASCGNRAKARRHYLKTRRG